MFDYSDSHQVPGKGEDYDRDLETSPLSMYLWRKEQLILEGWLKELDSTRSALDFAAGTGRISVFLSQRFDRVLALDISQAMLELVPTKDATIEPVCADFRLNPEAVAGPFDVVTAFRFFPNAQPDLRVSALDFIASRVRIGGLFIVNNHQNASSFLFRIGRLLKKTWANSALENEGLIREVEQHGFQLEEAVGMGVLPGSARRIFLPPVIHSAADSISSTVGLDVQWGQNVLMRFRRS